MKVQKSTTESFLNRLENLPKEGGRFAFVRLLNDILNSVITEDFAELSSKVRKKADKIGMEDNMLVCAVLRHIQNTRVLQRTLRRGPLPQAVGGVTARIVHLKK